MSTKDGPANIVNIQDERARHSDGVLPLGEYAHVGAMLAAVREEAGYTLAEIAERIHIKEMHLEAIETMNAEGLPARPYALGFVKTYAEFLDLDSAQTLSRFKEETGEPRPVAETTKKFEEKSQPSEEPGPLSIWALVGAFAFILFCAWQITRPHDVTIPGDPDRTVTPIAPPPAGEALTDPSSAPPIEPGAEIIEARILERVDPVYPVNCASGAAATERVVVAYIIQGNGRVSSERISESSNDCFNDAALNAIRRWRFSPRTIDGAPRPAYDQKFSFAFDRP